MRRFFAICFVFLATAVACMGLRTIRPPIAASPPVVYRVQQYDDSYQIRLVALKHSHISMADGDANLAIQAVRTAAGKGLAIRDVGNHNIDRNGEVRLVEWTDNDLDKLQAYVSQIMKIDAQPGDTFIIFTIGHGFPDGSIQNMGPRAGVMKAFANAAEENGQRTLWWQLSCHASAGLPAISTLPEAQQELFSVLASSTASETSAAGVQGKIMEKVFVALAGKDRSLDDGSGIVTAGRLRNFLNGVSRGRGDLLYAANPDAPIFGGTSLANSLPIIDRNGPARRIPVATFHFREESDNVSYIRQ